MHVWRIHLNIRCLLNCFSVKPDLPVFILICPIVTKTNLKRSPLLCSLMSFVPFFSYFFLQCQLYTFKTIVLPVARPVDR